MKYLVNSRLKCRRPVAAHVPVAATHSLADIAPVLTQSNDAGEHFAVRWPVLARRRADPGSGQVHCKPFEIGQRAMGESSAVRSAQNDTGRFECFLPPGCA